MPKFSANLTMLFTEMPFLDRFAAARTAGFRGVEYVSPYEFYPGDIRRPAARPTGLSQVLFNLPAGDWAAGERGIAIFQNASANFATASHGDPLCQGARLSAGQLSGRHRA